VVLRVVLWLLLAGGGGMAADWKSGVTSGFRDMRNPYASDRRAMSKGRQLYGDYCSDCHAARGAGTAGGPSLRRARLGQTRPGEIFWLLRNGAGARMPAFRFLGDKDLWALVDFVRQFP
jgi:mono/diheme cytochrome c family protein